MAFLKLKAPLRKRAARSSLIAQFTAFLLELVFRSFFRAFPSASTHRTSLRQEALQLGILIFKSLQAFGLRHVMPPYFERHL